MFEHREFAKRALRELRVQRFLGKHPNILKIIDLYVDLTSVEQLKYETIYICTEKMDSDLHDALRIWDMRENKILYTTLLYQILRALEYMHANGIMHRDVKPGNILVNNQGVVKVSDMGLCKFKDGVLYRHEEDLTDMVVTRWYRPPELIMHYTRNHYDEKVDCWSVGCVAFEMLTREILFRSDDEVKQQELLLQYLGPLPQEFLQNV